MLQECKGRSLRDLHQPFEILQNDIQNLSICIFSIHPSIHSFIYSFFHSFIHSFIYISHIHSFIQSLFSLASTLTIIFTLKNLLIHIDKNTETLHKFWCNSCARKKVYKDFKTNKLSIKRNAHMW